LIDRIIRGATILALALGAGVAHAQLGLKPPSAQPGAAPPGAAPQSEAPGPATSPPAALRAAPPVAATRSTGTSGRSALLDRVVAVVNADVITKRELDNRVQLFTQQLRQQKVPLPTQEILEKQVLERTIMDRAQLQFARDTGIRVDDLVLDRTVARIAEQNRLSLPEFRALLERDGIPYDRFREDLRGEITISRLREREVDSRIQVSDTEIDGFLEDQKAGPQNVEYNLRHILVRVPEQATPDQIERQLSRARQARQQAAAGTDFAQLAVSFSDAPDALQGGVLGWRQRDRLPELFTAMLDKMNPGDVSDVVRSPAGFHIVKLEDKRGASAGARQVEQTHARHILARTSEVVSEAEARRKLTLLRERLRDGADFGDLARLNSDDPSAARGGDLGWIYPGDTVPEFERAMNALKIGDISDPVKSPFGWHLIEVMERRTADVAPDRQRLEARRVLAERKVDETYQEWLRQLRDRTYVEYRLEER